MNRLPREVLLRDRADAREQNDDPLPGLDQITRTSPATAPLGTLRVVGRRGRTEYLATSRATSSLHVIVDQDGLVVGHVHAEPDLKEWRPLIYASERMLTTLARRNPRFLSEIRAAFRE